MIQHKQEFLRGLLLLSNILESLAFEKFTKKYWVNKRDVEDFGQNIKGINLAPDEFRIGIMNNLPEVKRYLQRELLENTVWLKKNFSGYFTEKSYAKTKLDFPGSRYISPLDNIIPYGNDHVVEETTDSFDCETVLPRNIKKRETDQEEKNDSFRKGQKVGETRMKRIKNKLKDDLNLIKNPEIQLRNQKDILKNEVESKKQEEFESDNSKQILEDKTRDNGLFEAKEEFPGVKQTETYVDFLTVEPANELSKSKGRVGSKGLAEELEDYDDEPGTANYDDDDFSDGDDAFTVATPTTEPAIPPAELLAPAAFAANTYKLKNSLILKTNISLFAIWFVGIFILTVFLTCGCFYIFVICLDSKHDGPGFTTYSKFKCKTRCKPLDCNQKCLKDASDEGEEK